MQGSIYSPPIFFQLGYIAILKQNTKEYHPLTNYDFLGKIKSSIFFCFNNLSVEWDTIARYNIKSLKYHKYLSLPNWLSLNDRIVKTQFNFSLFKLITYKRRSLQSFVEFL